LGPGGGLLSDVVSVDPTSSCLSVYPIDNKD
jgi:hypothetical protein